jgi:glycoside/pentoside/hexuronide:cation symporter, GPH family
LSRVEPSPAAAALQPLHVAPAEPSAARLALFTFPSLAINVFIISLYSYLPPLYAGELGLGLALTGTIFMAMRFWDLLADLAIGAAIDRWPTRYGRRRPWIVLSVPLMLVALAITFFPTPPVGAATLVAGLLLLFTAYTLFFVPYQAWSAELSADYDGRSRVMLWAQVMTQLGIAAALLAAVFLERRGVGLAGQVAAIGWLVVATFPVSCLLLVWCFREPAGALAVQGAALRWRLLLGMVRQRALAQVLTVSVLLGLVGGLVIPILFFFVERALGLSAWSSATLLAMVLGSLPFMTPFSRAAARMGKHRALVGAALLGSASSIALALTPSGSVAFLLVAATLFGVAYGVGGFLTRALLADVVEEDTALSGESRAGIIFALQLSAEKIGPAIGVFASYSLLAWVGFDPNQTSPSEGSAINTLRTLVGAGGGGLFALAAVAILGYPLTREAIARFRAGRTSGVGTDP